MSEQDKSRLLDVFFELGSPSISFMTLCQSIGSEVKSAQHTRDTSELVVLSEVSRWLVPFTEHKCVQLLLEVSSDATCSKSSSRIHRHSLHC